MLSWAGVTASHNPSAKPISVLRGHSDLAASLVLRLAENVHQLVGVLGTSLSMVVLVSHSILSRTLLDIDGVDYLTDQTAGCQSGPHALSGGNRGDVPYE